MLQARVDALFDNRQKGKGAKGKRKEGVKVPELYDKGQFLRYARQSLI
jgi:hypothetical protein